MTSHLVHNYARLNGFKRNDKLPNSKQGAFLSCQESVEWNGGMTLNMTNVNKCHHSLS